MYYFRAFFRGFCPCKLSEDTYLWTSRSLDGSLDSVYRRGTYILVGNTYFPGAQWAVPSVGQLLHTPLDCFRHGFHCFIWLYLYLCLLQVFLDVCLCYMIEEPTGWSADSGFGCASPSHPRRQQIDLSCDCFSIRYLRTCSTRRRSEGKCHIVPVFVFLYRLEVCLVVWRESLSASFSSKCCKNFG